jgi:hypothetical protein
LEQDLSPTDAEYEKYVKRVKVCDSENSKEFQCNTCYHFAFDPLNCSNCEFVCCKSCFEQFEILAGKNKCHQCG